MTDAYDEYAYPSLPLAQTAPDLMAVQVRLRGLRTPAPRRSRVLEIGCSDGGNLAALAAYAPDAEFLGVDLNANAVRRAQSFGLPNLTVIEADLRDVDLGPCDYVIAHGLYSWLPQPDELLACVARHLADEGVAYVSYNALPGWRLQEMAADVVRREAGSDVAAARRVIAELLSALGDSRHAQAMRAALQLMQGKADYVLRHDDLEANSGASFVEDFVQSAAAYGLFYAGEARLADCAPESDVDLVRREQLRDYAVNRMFRQSLLTRRPVGSVRPEHLDGLWVSAPVTPLGGDRFLLDRDVEVRAAGQVRAHLLEIGAAWPGCVRCAQIPSLWPQVVNLYRAGAVHLSCDPVAAVKPGSRPMVVTHMRRCARRAEVLATPRHEALRLDDERSRQAVALMDGHTSRAEIAQALRGSSGDRVRADLDALIDALGRKGLFVS